MPVFPHSLKEGDPIKVFIEHLPDFFPGIKEYNFIIYKPSAGVEKRVNENTDSKSLLFGERKWDFERQLIESFDRANPEQGRIEKLLFHDVKEPARLIPVNSNGLKEWLNNTINSMDPEEAIGFVSKCTTAEGVVKHLPLMDFSCPPTGNYARFIIAALQQMGCKKGMLVDSGKSFHFYGFDLQSPVEWQAFMSYCILLSPFTDVRYIGHRLISGYSILRVGESKIKPGTPRIVQIF